MSRSRRFVWTVGFWVAAAAACSAPLQRPNLPPPEYEVRPQPSYEIPIAEDPLEAALAEIPETPEAPAEKNPLDETPAKSERAPDAGAPPDSDSSHVRDNEESHPASPSLGD